MNDLDMPKQNYLLNALPEEVYQRLTPHLEEVDMFLGKVIYESGDNLNYAYFPTTCIVSLLYVMENGASAEIAVVGNDGMIGVALFMGGAKHAEPGYRTKCRQTLPAEKTTADAGV